MSLNPPNTPGLVLERVVKRYGATTAVDGFSMTAGHGEITALLGPNGAGKTTTIEICEGFHAPDSGSVRVLGLDPAREPERVRERIGIMLQGGGAYSGIRVRELLRLTASYNRDPLDPDWLIDLLGLERVAKTTYRRLSGGQQQRLSLALAVVGRPELVFLDEPTAGLDAQSRLAVWDLVRALRRDGVTVLLTTHLMDEAESLADQVVIIDHGRRVAASTPAELTAGTDGTRQDVALDVDGDLDARLLAVAAGVPEEAVSRVRPRAWRVTLDPAGPNQVARLVTAVAEQGVTVRGLEVAHRRLEDVFLDLTGRSLRR